MKKIVITTGTKENTNKILAFLNETGLAETIRIEDEREEKPPFKKLTAKDVALGIGRPASKEELTDYFERHKERTFIDIDDAFATVLNKPAKKKTKKKA